MPIDQQQLDSAIGLDDENNIIAYYLMKNIPFLFVINITQYIIKIAENTFLFRIGSVWNTW